MFYGRLILFVVILVVLPVSAEVKTRLQVFVSVPPQRWLVERIGGESVEVFVMLSAGQTPETFDPSLRQVKALADAQVYFLVGVPFESSLKDTLERNYPGLRVIDCCDAILKEEERKLDPHVWTSPTRVAELAGLVFHVLREENPAGRAEYADSYERLLEDLSELDDRARRRLAGRRTDYFITAHASWGYMARDYGLKEVSIERNGREIGPKGMIRLLDIARREALDTVFVQPQFRSTVVRTLAEAIGADIQILDPLAEDYLANMNLVIERLAGALR